MDSDTSTIVDDALRGVGPVHAAVRDGVAVVELHRPERRNAISSETVRVLPAVVTQLGRLATTRCVVLTGAGSAFCAGLDLYELGSTGANLRLPLEPAFPYPWGGIPVPVIGAINGPAVAGGFELAMACDILILGRSARFADTHARVGQVPGAGLSVRLSRAIGPQRAAYLHTTGNFIDADTAAAWGLAVDVVDDDQLMDSALGIADAIASNDGEAVSGVLELLRLTNGQPLGEALATELAFTRKWQDDHHDPEVVAKRRAHILTRASQQLADLGPVP